MFYGALRTFSTFGLGWARRLVSSAREAYDVWSAEKRAAAGAGETTPLTSAPLNINAQLRRHFFNRDGVQVFGSFFTIWGGWATAGHVVTQMLGNTPEFATGEAVVTPAGLDVALIGCTLPDRQPSLPILGQRVVVAGFPGGSSKLSHRRGKVHMQRPNDPGQTWIVQFDDGYDPVVVGMSGGGVFDETSGEAIGILVTAQLSGRH